MDLEILEGFREEANQILKELATVVEGLDETTTEFPAALLTEFAQKIDRIMGAAKTLSMESPDHVGLKRIGQIAEICKVLGYKASEIKRLSIIPVFAAFWADTLDAISELIEALEDEKESSAIAGRFSLVLEKRLRWLSDKLTALNPKASGTLSSGSGADAAPSAPASQIDVDELLKGFGI